MDPKERRSRSPSLLDADSHESASAARPERILSGFKGDNAASAPAARPRHWLWFSVLVLVGAAAVLMLILGGAFDGSAARSPTPVTVSGNPASAVPAKDTTVSPNDEEGPLPSASPPTSPEAAGSPATDAAVILPDRAEAAATAASTPAPASSVSKDSLALGAMFSPPEPKKAATPSRRGKPTPNAADDSDVALLTALIKHVEAGGPGTRKALGQSGNQKPLDPIELRMQACPAANTEAGLKCRQKLCAGHSGLVAACPASSNNGM